MYTPVEVVDFIVRAADFVSRKHFGRGLTDEGVHILDGFAGTGTFITRLLQSDLITAADLTRKYSQELHANEIMLLAYYIAAVNIESTYHALAGKTADADAYEPFPGWRWPTRSRFPKPGTRWTRSCSRTTTLGSCDSWRRRSA